MPYFGLDIHVCKSMSLPIQLESFKFAGAGLCPYSQSHFCAATCSYIFSCCLVLQIHPKYAPKQILGKNWSLAMLRTRPSRLQMHIFPVQLESLRCCHLLVLFGLYYKSIHELAQEPDCREIQSLAMLRTRHSRLQEHALAHAAGIMLVRPPTRALVLVPKQQLHEE